MTIEAHGEISAVDDDQRLVFGWAYVTHDHTGTVVVDKSGEFVDDVRELEDGAYAFVTDVRRGGLDHDPTAHVSDLVESMVFTPEKTAALGLPVGSLPTGWWVGFRITDERVWELVKNGERTAFSVHGKALSKDVTPA